MLRWFLLAGRVVLGAVFLYAAYTKLSQPWMLFAFSINSYQILPQWAVEFAAQALPWAEAALGALLISGFKLRYSAGAASALLVAFIAVMLRAYFRGEAIDCGCFGFGEALTWKTLVRDGLLAALAVGVTIGAFLRTRRPAPSATREAVPATAEKQ